FIAGGVPARGDMATGAAPARAGPTRALDPGTVRADGPPALPVAAVPAAAAAAAGDPDRRPARRGNDPPLRRALLALARARRRAGGGDDRRCRDLPRLRARLRNQRGRDLRRVVLHRRLRARVSARARPADAPRRPPLRPRR